MKTPFEIIRKPIITEKTARGQAMERPQYTFQVLAEANKREVRAAIESAYPGVKVRKVNSMNLEGKKRRMRQRQGKRPDWKKMIVILEKGSAIELY